MQSLTILCDLDGIVADLWPDWLAVYNRKYEDNLTVKDIKGWDTHHYVKKECGEEIYDYLQPELFNKLPPINGSIASLRRLSRKHKVVFVTASPIGCELAKIKWVEKHFPGMNQNDVVLCHQKELIKGDVFIDDSPKNIRAYRDAWPTSEILTIAYPYNEDVKNLVDIYSEGYLDGNNVWDEIEEHINSIAATKPLSKGFIE